MNTQSIQIFHVFLNLGDSNYKAFWSDMSLDYIYVFLHITSALPLFSALTAVFGEEHDLLLSLLRWAIGLEQKSTKQCQTQNCLHDARVYIWSMSFDSKWTIYSCSMILAHSWKLWFGLYVQNSIDLNSVSFLFFRFSLSETGQKGSISFILGARAGAASVYNWATETWWPPPIARR